MSNLITKGILSDSEDRQTCWSKYVHTPECLAAHRELRFCEETTPLLKSSLGIANGKSIIEVGCGPGVLCGKLKDWFPNSIIYGFDRDEQFIKYAQQHYKGVSFFVEDATNIHLNKKFDISISHTVFEYMPSNIFFNANRELLKKDGDLIIISNLHQIYLADELLNPPINSFMNVVKSISNSKSMSHITCPQNYKETDIGKLLRENGFELLTMHYITSEVIIGNFEIERQRKILGIYKEIAKSKVITTIRRYGIIQEANLNIILDEIDNYYTDYLKTIKEKWPVNIDVLRIVKAKFKGKCT